MAEPPPQGRVPPDGAGEEGEKPAKTGESDPLFNPPQMKARKTVMGLAPAPHLGGDASPKEHETAEARKQRVLARIAALDAAVRAKGPTPPRPASIPPAGAMGGPIPAAPIVSVSSQPGSVPSGPGPAPGSVKPAPGSVKPAPGSVAPAPGSGPPPRAAGSSRPPPGAGSARPPGSSAPPPGPGRQDATVVLPPAQRQPQKLQSGTLLMTPGTPNVPLTLPKGHSSDRNIPVSLPSAQRTGPPPSVQDQGPTTERMFRPATPAEPVAPLVAQAQQTPHQQTPPTAALALRPWEPPRPVTPPPPEQLDRRLILITEPHSARAASFRLLRDSLVAKNMPRVVAVTSAAPKEGKTTCAANLALALAEQTGTRVLLLDANWFAPELHEIFKIAKFPSIAPPTASSWLAPYKLVESRPTLHVGGIPLTAGEPPPRFDQQRFDAMIDRLVRVAYDYIIVDAPALKGSPAVVQLLGSADGTLVSVRTGGTTTRDLRRAVDQIPKAKALGIALVDA